MNIILHLKKQKQRWDLIMSSNIESSWILAIYWQFTTYYWMCFTMRNKLTGVTILKITSFTFERPTTHLEKLFASMSNKLCILQSPILPELISQYWQRIWIPNWIRICFSSKQVLKTHCLLFRVYQSCCSRSFWQ